MTKALADKIEAFLTANLDPEHGYILIVGETGTTNTGIISNYSGERVSQILKTFADVSYLPGKPELN
jgi:hypothetical protein